MQTILERSRDHNLAILEAFKNELISSTTIMANMKEFENALEIIKKYDLNGKVGIHLNISEGRPLTDEIKKYNFFCDENGNFTNKKNDVTQLIKLPCNKGIQALKAELNAQINKCINCGLTLTHADSHNDKHIQPYMFMLLSSVLKDNNINKVRIARISYQNKLSIKSVYRKFYNFHIRNYFKMGVADCLMISDDIEHLKSRNKVIELMCHLSLKNGVIMEGNKKLTDITEALKRKSKFEMINYAEL